jgi:hypothetical protein
MRPHAHSTFAQQPRISFSRVTASKCRRNSIAQWICHRPDVPRSHVRNARARTYGAELSMPHLGDDPVAHRRRRRHHHRRSAAAAPTPTRRPYGAELSMPQLGDDPIARRRRRDRSDRRAAGSAANPNIAKTELAPAATPREGIKNTIAPAGNVGERARCRESMCPLQNLPALMSMTR